MNALSTPLPGASAEAPALSPTLLRLVADTEATLAHIADAYSPAVFASSLAAEDMVITDLILKAGLPIKIFSLETGRLHPETLAVLDQIKAHYGYDVELYRPQAEAVEAYVAEHGLNAFYNSIELRRACCGIRKVEPLGRALAGNRAWITGQRRAQSSTRADLTVQEDDLAHNMVKFNPLIEWSEQDVWDYIRANNVPYNVLHDQGFPSIGCAPCTRSVQPGEDIRSGRWWWENPDSKECGLHMVDGKLIRIKSAGA